MTKKDFINRPVGRCHCEERGYIRLVPARSPRFARNGADASDSFNVGMIRSKKILFTPGPAFKKILADLVFDKEKEKK